ncbi:MAG: ATP-binding protein [Planctomycetota bacterium]
MAGAEAQAGFYYQNLVAALHLLDLIEVGSKVLSVTLENPSRAKYIDDIIVDTGEGARFIQVKWSEDQHCSLTLGNLVAKEKGGSLWEKLACGYQQIRTEHGEKVVELLSTRRAGVNQQPAQGFPYSLEQFITEFHIPYIGTPDVPMNGIDSYPLYEQTIETLRTESGILDRDVFSLFLRSLRFSLGQDDRNTAETRVRSRLHQLGIEQQQFATLLDECVKWSIRSAQVNAIDLLRALGLADRFAERLGHRFPVDDALWVPTPMLFEALDSALQNLSSGFIVVVGEPGIGKSTALTKYLRDSSKIRFGYYCFIPDERVIGNERLQEDAFVRSICAGLKSAFPDFKFPTPYAPPTIHLLNAWLAALSQSKERVVFMVDGLDHVDRKMRHSLLAKPLTKVLDGRLPENVLIVLTTRYEQAIPQSIAAHLKQEPIRRIEVKRFGREQVAEFMHLRGVLLGKELLGQVLDVSAGVPIYLEYLASVLFGMAVDEQRQYLNRAPTLSDHKIDHFHNCMWQEWSTDPDITYLLAVLAVREEYTPPELLQTFLKSIGHNMSLAVVIKKLQTVKYVLKVSEAKGFAISHASLAEFINERTSQLRPEITRAVLDWYKDQPTTNEAWRHRLRHLFELGQDQEVLEACDNEWVNRAWRFYRPTAETQRNLDIAWRASVRANDLLSFIRIGLLKQQAGLISQNVDLKRVDIATVLLDIGLSDVALNNVWDGERSLVSASDFAMFAEHYANRVGRVLPVAVVREALDSRAGCSYEEARLIYRVASLAISPADLMAEISGLRWRSKSRSGHSIEMSDDEENSGLNLNLQLDLLKGLAKRASVDKIYGLASLQTPGTVLYTAVTAALVVALARADSTADAIASASSLLLSSLPSNYLGWLQVELSLQGVPFTPVDSMDVPDLPTSLKKDHHFNPNLANAFQAFRVSMMNRPDALTALRAASISLSGPVGTVVSALISLAELWVQSISQRASTSSATRLEAICDSLAIRGTEFDDDGSGFNYDATLYNGSAHKLYKHVWDCAVELLDHEAQLALARSWLRAEGGLRCARFINATRDLATSLAQNRAEGAAEVKRELLARVEAQARLEEETITLTASLLDTARSWGICGYRDDGIRIWNDVAIVACGVYSRKDYQFSEIFLPLRLAHENDPSGSRKRIIEQLELAHQLEDTGAGKQLAIALEGLIGLVARWWPTLAFQGLLAEDLNIFRERALRKVLSEFVIMPKIDKRLLLAVLKTFAHWENYRHFNDETAPAMKEFFVALLEQRNYEVALETYRFARHMFLVKKEMPQLLGDWANTWTTLAAPTNDIVDQDKMSFYKAQHNEKPQSTFDENRAELREALAALDPKNIPALKQHVEELAGHEQRDDKAQLLARSRDEWRRAFLVASSLTEVPSGLEQQVEDFLQSFENTVLDLAGVNNSEAHAAVVNLVHSSLQEFATLVGGQVNASLLEDAFDLDSWLDNLLRPTRMGFRLEGELRTILPHWIQQSSFALLKDWLNFIREKCASESRAYGLLAVAKRFAKSRTDDTFQLIEEARDCEANFFFEHHDLSQEICALALQLDHDRGSRFVLDCFRHQYSLYPTSMVFKLDSLIDLLSGTATLDGVALYNVWALHNRRLAAGLSQKQVDLGWMSLENSYDFEHACVGYLVSLLQYPEVDVRLLSVEALVELLTQRPDLVDYLRADWPQLSLGQREYLASTLDSLGRMRPELIARWAQWLTENVVAEGHYSLRATVASALGEDHYCKEPENPAFQRVRELLEPPNIVRPLTPQIVRGEHTTIRLPPYPRWMMDMFSKGCGSPRLMRQETLRLLRAMYPNAEDGLKEEYAVHRRHNINTNFDNLEIAASFDEACRASINQTLVRLLESHEIDPEHVAKNLDILRLRDPTDSLVRPVARPARVEWLAQAASDSEFLEFADIKDTFGNALSLEEGFVRLFEYTEQRGCNEIGNSSRRACIARVELFGLILPRAEQLRQVVLDRLSNTLRIRDRNAYRTEMTKRGIPDTQPFVPLVVVADRAFRGRKTRELAALSEIWKKHLPLTPNSDDLLGANLGASVLSRSVEWQEAFDQDRRLHEPRSSGYLLEVNSAVLQQLASTLDLRIFARIELKRTTERYKPESHMNWLSRLEIVDLSDQYAEHSLTKPN